MALITTDEQEALRDVMQAFLEKYSSESVVRGVMDGVAGYDPEAWRMAAEQIGVQGLLIPEEMGGGGYGFDELAIVMEEAGRTLFPAPLLSTAVLATSALLAVGGPQASVYLGRIAKGDLIATLAISESRLHWDPADIATTAQKSGNGWTVSGTKPYVLDGAQADVILVAAQTSAGVSLFAVESGARGLSVEALESMDQTRRLASVGFDHTPAVLLGDDGAGWAELGGVYDRALVALACEQVGGAQAVLEMTVAYLNMRHQFGRPIGSFQAIKHRCADLLGGGGVRTLGGRLCQRGVVHRRRRRLGGCVDREGLLLAGLLSRCGREYSDARRHRVHLGAPRAPVLQTGEEFGGVVRLAGRSPRPDRTADWADLGDQPFFARAFATASRCSADPMLSNSPVSAASKAPSNWAST